VNWEKPNIMRNNLRILCFWIAALTVLPGILAAQPSTLPGFITDSLDIYVNRALEKWDIPGVAVAIVKDGKAVILRGYGTTQKGGKEKVDANTLFMMASNVKAFTGTALAMLEQEGKCSLNDNVNIWLPGFQLYDTVAARNATLRDLLTHDLGYSTFQADWLCFYSTLKPEDVYNYYKLVKPPYTFRSRYGYSNIGYFFAGECIRSITGKPWDEYVQKNLLNPLEMNRTLLKTSDLDKVVNIAYGHTLDGGKLKMFPHPNADLIAPAAGMTSSATDLSHWLLAQLNKGQYNGKLVIPSGAMDQTRKPFTIIGRNQHIFNRTHYELYGLGWTLEDYESTEVISHSGGIWGFVTGVSFVPELNLGVAILTNSDENWFYEALKWEIIDAFLGLPYRNYSEEYLRIYRQRAEMKRMNEETWESKVTQNFPFGLEASDFEGTWSNDLYGKMEIKVYKGDLIATFEHHPGMEALLRPMKDDTFLCRYTPSRWGTFNLNVTMDDAGRLSIDIRVADRLDPGTYRFGKIVAF
jgi:CubicO group peptidase (beta-lactamase class C family)